MYSNFENRLKFKNLTEQQKEKLLNGCGVKGGWVNVPDFIFTACCDHHDFKYWRGKGPSIFSFEFWKSPILYFLEKKNDRILADSQFFSAMIKDAESIDDESLRTKYIAIAYVYFKAVRNFGWIRYNWGGEKTEKDLP
jgi:hypothetical protein